MIVREIDGPDGPRADLLLRRVRDRHRRLGAGHQPVRPAQRAGGQGRHQPRAGRGRRGPARRRPTTSCARCSAASARRATWRSWATSSRRADFDAAVSELRQVVRDATQVGDDVRLRAALPALDRPAAQGRPADRALPAARPRLGARRRDPRRRLRLHAPQARAGDRRPRDAARARPAGRARDARGRRSGRGAARADRAPEGAAVSAVAAGAPTTRSSRGSSACRSTRRRWSSSARPATWPSASCCRRSTTSPTRARCPSASTSSACRARTMPHEEFRDDGAARPSSEFSRREPDDGGARQAARRGRATSRARSTTPSVYDDAERRRSTSSTRPPAQRMNRCFYLSTAPTFFPVIVGQLGEHKLCQPRGRRRARRDREAVRDDAGRGRAAQPRGAVGPRRAAGLPHRPLPGQGDRPEHAWRSGSPTGSSSPCGTATTSTSIQITAAEDIGIGSRAGYYDTRRRAARPHPEPHAPAAVPRGDGAAGQLHRRRGAQREGQGPAGDPRADAEEQIDEIAVRAQYAEGESGGEHVVGLPAGGGRPGRLQHRDLRRPAPGGRQLALGRACRSTCAPASAWRARSPRSR